MRSVVVLPQPDGPTIVKNSPGGMLKVDAVDGDDVGTECLDELLEADFTLHGALDLQAGGDRFGAFGAGEPPVDDEYERERSQRDRK